MCRLWCEVLGCAGDKCNFCYFSVEDGKMCLLEMEEGGPAIPGFVH